VWCVPAEPTLRALSSPVLTIRVMESFATFGAAYVHLIREILEEGERVPGVRDSTSVGSNFGLSDRPTRELIGHAFEIADPSASVVVSPKRSAHLEFSVGLFLWTLAGSDNESWIRYYNPRASDFSEDGVHLSAAFGRRLFTESGVDQLEAIAKRMTSDPHTRRSAATILLPHDNQSPTRDYPCAIAVQYFQRDDALHALTFMRSQSALRVLPYDVFVFMNLQRWFAARMGLKAGTYKHISSSLHLYEDEVAASESLIEAGVATAHMSSFGAADDLPLEELLSMEADLRTAVRSTSTSPVRRAVSQALDDAGSASFYRDCRTVLLLEATRRLEMRASFDELTRRLQPSLRRAIEN
jgi:thymidylate synthase